MSYVATLYTNYGECELCHKKAGRTFGLCDDCLQTALYEIAIAEMANNG